jgi:sec-independent protein translocase protein TatA
MFRDISPWHLGLILLAFVILFGYKKLPDATRSLGRSMRIFKSEVKGMHEDGDAKQLPTAQQNESAASAPAAPATPAAPQTPAAQAPAAPAVERTGEAVDAGRTSDGRVEPGRS